MRPVGPPERRGVLAVTLGGLIASSAATAAAPLQPEVSRAPVLPPGVPSRKESEAAMRAPRYRRTEHVEAFYRTNRY